MFIGLTSLTAFYAVYTGILAQLKLFQLNERMRMQQEVMLEIFEKQNEATLVFQ